MKAKAAPLFFEAAIVWPRRENCKDTATGVSSLRLSLHAVELACGSRSRITADCPARSAATARCTQRVVFPVPPFWLKNETVFMFSCFHVFKMFSCFHINMFSCLRQRVRLDERKKSSCLLTFLLIIRIFMNEAQEFEWDADKAE